VFKILATAVLVTNLTTPLCAAETTPEAAVRAVLDAFHAAAAEADGEIYFGLLTTDAVYIGTAALLSVGCTLCGRCYTGKCPWGIATNDAKLAKRQNPEVAAKRMANLIRAWSHEIEEMLGGMGLNSIESVRGNRDKLRGVGLNQVELDTLGVKPAGR